MWFYLKAFLVIFEHFLVYDLLKVIPLINVLNSDILEMFIVYFRGNRITLICTWHILPELKDVFVKS